MFAAFVGMLLVAAAGRPVWQSPVRSELSRGSSATLPYTFAGHTIYTANDWFTTNLITGSSRYARNTVDFNSGKILSSFYTNNGNATFNINGTNKSVSLNWPVNIARPSTPFVGVTSASCHFGCFKDRYDAEGASTPLTCRFSCSWKMPWQSTFKAQGTCNGSYGGDCHLEVFNPSTGAVYEAYKSCPEGSSNCAYTGSELLIGSGAVHNVNHSWNSQMNGGSNNAGIPWMGTALWGEDASLPSINHIIEVAIPGNDGAPNTSGGWVAPATYGNPCATNCADKVPMGARLRLNPSKYTCPSTTANPQAHKICVAMETYGIIVVDHNGTSDRFGPSIMPKSDGTNPWNANDLAALNGIPITDFDLMTLGTVHDYR